MFQDSAAEMIAEELLFQTGKALMEADDDLFISYLKLPQLMETIEGKRLICSEEEVRQILSDLRQIMIEQDIIDLVRTVVSAEFLDADTIGSTHVALMVARNGQKKRAPYPVYSIIKRFGLDWKIVSCLYAILDCPDHNAALLSTLADRPRCKSNS